jgi:two-component system, NarL family, sensor histidine kinase DesK
VVLACANMILTGGVLVDLAIAVVCGAALLAVQLGVVLRPREELSGRVRYGALIAEACLVFLPILKLSVSWAGLPGFLVGALLLLLRPAASIPLAIGIAGSMGWYTWVIFRQPFEIVYTMVATTVTGLVIFGLTRLYQLVVQVHAAQGLLTQLAVAEERARFSRDVHDLLGLGLSAVILKTELIAKVLDDEPERARRELAEVMQLTRQAFDETRQVATGYQGLTLAEECRSAMSVLTTADVKVSLVREDDGFPALVRSTLATVLREGVTNVLRHSDATWCTITISRRDGAAELEVVNDGVPAPQPVRSDAGRGLPNLQERVRSLGGDLVSEAHFTAAIVGEGCHRLRARIPLGEPAPGGAVDDR